MGCICDKEVRFFGEGSRDTSHLLYIFLTVYRHDLIGLKKLAILAGRKRPEGKEWAKDSQRACKVSPLF
jgi:hypothetical protein